MFECNWNITVETFFPPNSWVEIKAHNRIKKDFMSVETILVGTVILPKACISQVRKDSFDTSNSWGKKVIFFSDIISIEKTTSPTPCECHESK